MSIDPERPADFVAWAGAEATPGAFLSARARYRRLRVARFAEAIRESRGKLRVVRGGRVGVDARAVRLADGTAACPRRSSCSPPGSRRASRPPALPDDARILDAWDECAVAALPRDGRCSSSARGSPRSTSSRCSTRTASAARRPSSRGAGSCRARTSPRA